jgi:hypothetical protein
MTTLLDTHILTRSAQPHHPMHQPAVDAVALLRQSGEALHLAPQNLYEFWVRRRSRPDYATWAV